MKRLTAMLALCLAPILVHAQAFVELSLGEADFGLGSAPGVDVKDTDTSWAISGGYMFNPTIGAEVGYRSLGEASVSGITPGGDSVRATIDFAGVFAGMVGRFPMADRLHFLGRFGLFLWEGEGRLVENGVLTESIDDDGTDLYFGVGASYAVSRNVDVGVGWTRYDVDGDNLDALELKLRFNF